MAARIFGRRTFCMENFFRATSCRRFSSVQQSSSAEPLTLCSQDERGIRRIVLNNPRKRNALSLAMLESIESDIRNNLDDSVRVIIISANGSVFSSGHDLKELTQERGTDSHQQLFRKCSEVMSLVQDIPVPVIAQVNGLATAAGCQLVASCDIAIATEKTKFATPGVSIGLFCSTPGVALARAVPRKVAMEMLLTGHPIPAEDALKHGLVSKVVPEAELEAEVDVIAQRICSVSQPVLALGKACFYSQIVQTRDQAYRQAESVMVENLKLQDGQEGIKAFIEKRQPTWTHKSD